MLNAPSQSGRRTRNGFVEFGHISSLEPAHRKELRFILHPFRRTAIDNRLPWLRASESSVKRARVKSDIESFTGQRAVPCIGKFMNVKPIEFLFKKNVYLS